MAQLIVGLTSTMADALDRGTATKDSARLQQLIDSAGLELKPQSTRSLLPPDPAQEETVWYWADASDLADGDVCVPLMSVPGVIAAYLKPDEELP